MSRLMVQPVPDFLVGLGEEVSLGCFVTNIATARALQTTLSWDVVSPAGARVDGNEEDIGLEAGHTLARNW